MNGWAQGEGQPGLGYIIFEKSPGGSPADADPPGKGPIANNLGQVRTRAIREQLGLKAGDAVFFVAGLPKEFVDFAGRARTKIASDLGLIDTSGFEFCWVVDFPMFEWNEEEEKIDFSHNPFSMPQGGLEALLTTKPEEILAYQYDLVCNGVELSSGAIRNHKPEIMEKAFAIAGYSKEDLEKRFGGMLRALQ
jgi:aspartyl-tRNA synthetase